MKRVIGILIVATGWLPAQAQSPGGVNTNLRLWLKANAGVTGSPVSSWADQSGNGFTASQATVAQRPAIIANRLNFNPAIQFDGANDDLTIASGILAAATITDVYVFGVYRTNTVSNSSVFRELAASGGRFNAHVPWGDNVAYWDAGSAGGTQRISTPWVSSTGTSYLWTFTASTTATPSGARQDIYRNGLILANDNNMSSFVGSNSALMLGDGYGQYNGEIAEFIIYQGAISAVQLQRIHSYLALKYGLTLDQSAAQNYVSSAGTVIWNGTTLAAHNRAIAGIGRDDGSGLSQLKSTSHVGDVITAANNNFASPAAFGANDQFLTWGHNGLTASADPAASGFVHNSVSIAARLQRVWRTQRVGTPTGDLIIQFNMASIGGGTSANANLRLLIDDDATFGNSSAGEVVISPTAGFPVSGGVVDFAVPYASLAANQYFTLASTDGVNSPLASPSPGGISVAVQLWVKADAGVTGSPVSSWADQSGNGFTLTQGTVGSRPAINSNRINFNPALIFNGSSSEMTRTGGVMGTSSTYNDFNAILVTRSAAVAAGSVFYETQASSGRINAHVPWSDGLLYWDAGSAGGTQRLNTPWTGTVNTPYVWTLLASTTTTPSGARQDILKNGLLLANDNNMASFTSNASTFYLGSLAGGNFFNGDVAEMILLSGALTLAEQQRLESYLAVKYGITLDQTTPRSYHASNWNGITGTLIWDATTGGTYRQDIAAIGRDDNSSLSQKQSASVNTNNPLTIGNVTIAADNASNGNSFAVNRSFFSWAHNGLAMSASGVSDIGTTINGVAILARLARVWKAQETGTVGSLKVSFNLSSVLGTGGIAGNNDLANVRLLVDPDGVFATGATAISPTTFSNITDIVEFDVDFTGGLGFYFTVGSTNLTTTPLPIELASFEAEPGDNGVNLYWKTASERDNDFFEVQGSPDAEHWDSKGVVKGAGTTTETSEYHLLDKFPLQGVSYYRLKQVDFDGTTSFSSIRKVDFIGPTVKLYPNPVSDQATLQLSGASRGLAVEIYSLTGTLLVKSELDPSLTHQEIDISTVGWSSGIYLVRVIQTDGKVTLLRLLKAK